METESNEEFSLCKIVEILNSIVGECEFDPRIKNDLTRFKGIGENKYCIDYFFVFFNLRFNAIFCYVPN